MNMKNFRRVVTRKRRWIFTAFFCCFAALLCCLTSISKVKADEDGNAEKTISLKNGEKAEFYKIPYGTEYQIAEEKNKYAPSYMIDAATVKKTTDKASADTDLSTETETIDMGEDDTVTFTNEYLEQFTLPDAGSNTLELLTGVAFFALLIGYINRKQHY